MNDTMGKLIAFIPMAGRVAKCSRCGDPCRVADKTNKEARLLKHAEQPKGNCSSCAVVEWFWIAGCRELVPDPSNLAHKHVQEQFARVMISGGADMKPSEINWTKVIEHWNLPFVVGNKSYDPNQPPPTAKRSRRKKL